MPRLLRTFLIAVMVLTAGGAAPAKPAEAAFRLTQEVHTPDGQRARFQYVFASGLAVMTDENGRVVTVHNLVAPASYSQRTERMVDEVIIEAWLTGWRLGATITQWLWAPAKQQPYTWSLLWPNIQVTTEGETLQFRTKAMHAVVVPMKDSPPAEALAFGTMYRLEAYRAAYDDLSPWAAATSAAIAAELARRDVIPESIQIVTSTATGSASIHTAFRRTELREGDAARVLGLKRQLYPPPHAQPAEPSPSSR